MTLLSEFWCYLESAVLFAPRDLADFTHHLDKISKLGWLRHDLSRSKYQLPFGTFDTQLKTTTGAALGLIRPV